jgi:glyoxylase-like metal-dependent hydrolase (beta-lactamase superfamily II)
LQPTAGKAMANIKAAGVDPADIEAVLLTHMHPDHSAGLTDMATGRRNFPNAELVVHENEPRHWFDDAKMAGATERARKLYFQCVREQTAPYRDRMRLFKEGEIFPGVTATPRHGHTPGHMTFMIGCSSGEKGCSSSRSCCSIRLQVGSHSFSRGSLSEQWMVLY